MGHISATFEQSTTWNLERFFVDDANTVAAYDVMPQVSLPHLAIAGQIVTIDNNIAIEDISDKIPPILNWLAFCDHHSLLEENEKALLNKPSDDINHLNLTEQIIQTTFSRFNHHISGLWKAESKRLTSIGITADNFSENDLLTGETLKLEFEKNDMQYGGNEEVGLRLVDESNPTVFFMDTGRVNPHLALYLNVVIDKLTDMSGQAIGEIILSEYHFFGEYSEIIKELPINKIHALKAMIKTIKQSKFDLEDKACAIDAIKAINTVIDKKRDTIEQREYENIESIVCEMEETFDFVDRKNSVQTDLAISVMTAKKIANEQISRRNKGEKKILKMLNTIVEGVLSQRNGNYIAQSFGSGSDESYFTHHHVYLTKEKGIYDNIEQFFEYTVQSGEIPAYWINLAKTDSVTDDLIAFQQGYFCLSVLDELMTQIFEK